MQPTLPRLLAEVAASPDPDMALNNIERLASQGERAAFLRLLAAYPAAPLLLARLSGTSQFLADTLRRHPTLLPTSSRRISPRASSRSRAVRRA